MQLFTDHYKHSGVSVQNISLNQRKTLIKMSLKNIPFTSNFLLDSVGIFNKLISLSFVIQAHVVV